MYPQISSTEDMCHKTIGSINSRYPDVDRCYGITGFSLRLKEAGFSWKGIPGHQLVKIPFDRLGLFKIPLV